MKNLKYSFLLFISFLFLLPACKEDETPPIGHPGTLRCKVDGVEWTPEQPTIWTPFQLQYYDDTKYFSLSAERELEDQSINQSISFWADPIRIGENKITYRERIFKDWLKPGNCGFYDLDTLKPHILYVESIDKEKRFIQGTFHFTAYDNLCNETVKITDGEFNLGY